MLFHSLDFLVFFLIIFSVYLCLSHSWQNKWLLLASYVFYSFWDWRFLSLIIISTIIDFYCGNQIYASHDTRRKKFFLICSLISNLSILGFFKYFNFFLGSFTNLLHSFGFLGTPSYLYIILPVGISFYTFQSLSYSIDIYRGKLKPTKKFLDFALFVSFFPQLVAGPIERAKRLLPQIQNSRTLSYEKFFEGCFLIYWGLFEKIFIAGNLAKIVDPVFASHAPYEGAEVLTALYAFAFLIFCDFDAYSNIARGLAKCMGFEIMVNFNLPYFAANPKEFWGRWHISLSTWLKDYLYVPLGGNRCSQLRILRNLFLTMLLGGLWHGASWTFVLWGAYHGLLLILYKALPSIMHQEKWQNTKKFIQGVVFFHFTILGWLIFRAESLSQVGDMFSSLVFSFNLSLFAGSQFFKFLITIAPLLLIQIGQYKTNDLLFLYRRHWIIKTSTYAFMAYCTLGWGIMKAEEFIYFQF